ncbi:hypothetical protein BDN67DRAFT_1016748 [Paxillus ammoniavirescens]|nr:hypothetical protein BDN67DRAFT_1016748 [Paxillus ammoniavirescens]
MAIMQFTFSIDQPTPAGPNVGVMKLDLKPSAEFEETATQQAISSDGYYAMAILSDGHPQRQPFSATGTMAPWPATATDSNGWSAATISEVPCSMSLLSVTLLDQLIAPWPSPMDLEQVQNASCFQCHLCCATLNKLTEVPSMTPPPWAT